MALLAIPTVMMLCPLPVAARHLSFEERVDAQEAVERIYYSHQIGATRSFEEAVPRSLLEQKVRTYLKQEVALETFWKTPVTVGMLHRELERMAAQTRMPERLRELYAVLGQDPFLIQECLARPVLVDRLARNFFAYDQSIHGEARRKADTLREDLVDGRLDARSWHPNRTVTDLVPFKQTASGQRDDPTGERWRSESSGSRRLNLDPVAHDRYLSRFPAHPGEVGPVLAGRDRFVIRLMLEANAGQVRVVTYAVPKRGWDDWWWSVESNLEVKEPPLPPPGGPLPQPRLETMELSSRSFCLPDDTWDNESLDDLIGPRSAHTAVWTGTVMVVWGGSDGRVPLDTGGRYDPATDTWTPTSTKNAPSGRASHTAVWTGNLMIVWGGSGGWNLDTGGRYDPATDSWTPTSTIGAPPAGLWHTAVWTGSLMVVWGGRSSNYLNTGGRYDPVTDTWSQTSMAGAPTGRHEHTAVWSGSLMIVWGGYAGSGAYLDTGGLYNPVTDAWMPMSRTNAPSPRNYHTAIWTGDLMIVWGGHDDSSMKNTGARYEPVTDTWTPTAVSNAPSPRSFHTAVWTGSLMLVWGGNGGPPLVDDGGRYDPASDTWTATAMSNAPSERGTQTAVWTGSLMLVWGGDGGPPLDDGGRYDPASDTWTPIAFDTSAPTGRSMHTAIWTGSLMIVWGGYDDSSEKDTGARYEPATDTWTPTSTVNAPSVRDRHTAVWTGDLMIVWGGGDGPYLNTGGRYDPISDSWTPTRTSNAPIGRSGHTTVWTGSLMIVWGGTPGTSSFDTGGRYDPATNTWTTTSRTNAPARRTDHTAVWTGSRMIVWGGSVYFPNHLNTGGLYDPVNDTWTSISTNGAPSARFLHSAVWTGSGMIIWGGRDGFATLDTGGRYDPGTNTWTPIASTGAPSARGEHTAVWTGSLMVIWGGGPYGPMPLETSGGVYEPTTDTWTPTSTGGAPSGRLQHTAVWIGDAMVVWGGVGGQRSGGRYVLGPSKMDDDADGYSECQGDCEDGDPSIRPGAAEVCNNIDDNCDGQEDEDTAGLDSDSDGIHNACDNCRFAYNPMQTDIDRDAIGDACDNCVSLPNPDQADLDGDQRGDLCDNCPFDRNADQGDIDADLEGDACDLNDGLIWITLPDARTIAWQQEAGFDSFNWYRGDLSVLRQAGLYTQDPDLISLALRMCDLTQTLVSDGPDPGQREAVFYLVTGNGGGEESSLGTNSAGSVRPNANPCP